MIICCKLFCKVLSSNLDDLCGLRLIAICAPAWWKLWLQGFLGSCFQTHAMRALPAMVSGDPERQMHTKLQTPLLVPKDGEDCNALRATDAWAEV